VNLPRETVEMAPAQEAGGFVNQEREMSQERESLQNTQQRTPPANFDNFDDDIPF